MYRVYAFTQNDEQKTLGSTLVSLDGISWGHINMHVFAFERLHTPRHTRYTHTHLYMLIVYNSGTHRVFPNQCVRKLFSTFLSFIGRRVRIHYQKQRIYSLLLIFRKASISTRTSFSFQRMPTINAVLFHPT